MPSAKSIEETLTIHMVFGSEMQRSVHMNALRLFLIAWQHVFEAGHQKNKITITPDLSSASLPQPQDQSPRPSEGVVLI